MRTLRFHGELEQEFGPSFLFDAPDMATLLRSAFTLIPGLRKKVSEGSFSLVRGDEVIGPEELRLGMTWPFFEDINEVHLIPVPQGAKDDGVAKILIGTALIATSFITAGIGGGFGATLAFASAPSLGVSAGALFGLGASIALSGVAATISPSPEIRDFNEREHPRQRPSFLFNSTVNTTKEGLVVPVVYGEAFVGSVAASAGLYLERTTNKGEDFIVDDGDVRIVNVPRWATAADTTVRHVNLAGSEANDVKFYGLWQAQAIPYEPSETVEDGMFFVDRDRVAVTNDPSPPSPLADSIVQHMRNSVIADTTIPNPNGTTFRGGNIVTACEIQDPDTGNNYFQVMMRPSGLSKTYFDKVIVRYNGSNLYVLDTTDVGLVFDSSVVVKTARYTTSGTATVFNTPYSVWQWPLVSGSIRNLSSPGGGDDRTVQFRFKKNPTRTYSYNIQNERYTGVTWKSSNGTFNDVVGRFHGILLGNPDVGEVGPLDDDSPPDGANNISHNEYFYRGDEILAFGEYYDPSTGHLHYILVMEQNSRSQDFIDRVRIRDANGNLLVSKNQSSVDVFDDAYNFDGTTATAWIWEAASGTPVLNPRPNSNVTLEIRFELD